MFAQFETYIKEKAGLSNEEISLIRTKAIERPLRKKQALLTEGQVCRYKIFVCKGLLRTYRTRDDGSQHITWFSPENWWTTDAESLHKGVPSRYNIEALEDSEVILFTNNDFNELFKHIPDLKSYSERLVSNNLILNRERLFTALSATPEERYDEFMDTYPGLVGRVPLHMVASYLGLSRKTLTRIRYAQLKH